MSTRSTSVRRGHRRSYALSGALLASLLLGGLGSPTTSAAPAAPAQMRPLPAAVAAAPLFQAAQGEAQGVTAKKTKRRFGKLRIGISTGFSILDAGDRLGGDLDRAKSFGAGQLRLDISWAQIQPEPDVVDWSKTDHLFAATRAKGLNILAVIGFAPEWGEAPDGEVKPEAFGDFVDAAVRRYGSKVAAWEIWNEPNQTRSWIAKPDPAVYARVVEAASQAIRRHDPKAKILMGALAPAIDHPEGMEISPITFLQGVYRAGIKRSAYDAVSIHPFSYPALPSGDEEWNTFHRLPDIYRVVRRNGDGAKPLWLTEYGARTGSTSRSVSLERQRTLLLDAHRETRKLPFVQALFFYSLRDYSADRRDSEANFGLLTFDGTPKPAYNALRRVLRTYR